MYMSLSRPKPFMAPTSRNLSKVLLTYGTLDTWFCSLSDTTNTVSSPWLGSRKSWSLFALQIIKTCSPLSFHSHYFLLAKCFPDNYSLTSYSKLSSFNWNMTLLERSWLNITELLIISVFYFLHIMTAQMMTLYIKSPGFLAYISHHKHSKSLYCKTC